MPADQQLQELRDKLNGALAESNRSIATPGLGSLARIEHQSEACAYRHALQMIEEVYGPETFRCVVCCEENPIGLKPFRGPAVCETCAGVVADVHMIDSIAERFDQLTGDEGTALDEANQCLDRLMRWAYERGRWQESGDLGRLAETVGWAEPEFSSKVTP